MTEISRNYKLYIILAQIAMIFISSIIIISIIGTIKTKSKVYLLEKSEKFFLESYRAISAIFSLEFILTFFYGIIFAFYCLKIIDIKLTERIIILLFLILFFLHLIYCVIIPIYFNDFKCIINLLEYKKKYKDDKLEIGVLDEIKSNYTGAICISYIFLIILLFFNFILLIDYNKIFDVGILIKFLGEVLCAGFNERNKITELRREANQKTNQIREIFANNLREEIKKQTKN